MSAVTRVKTDFSTMTRPIGSSELSDGFDDSRELVVVTSHPRVEFGEFGGECLVIDHQLAQMNEGPDNLDARLGGGFAIENVGGLNRAVFREGEGEIFYVLTALQGRTLRP